MRLPYSMGTMFVLGLLSAVIADTASAAEVVEVGKTPAAWSDLPGTDGKSHSLTDYKEAKVVVIVFTSNGCIYAVDYEDRLIALQARYAKDRASVQIVAINSNAAKADSLDQMKIRAKEKEFAFPYLRDESQSVAKSYGAIYTPEFFVLNAKRELVYRGAMDDNTNPELVAVQYVALAVDAALKGEHPEVTEVGARGCTIRQKRRRRR